MPVVDAGLMLSPHPLQTLHHVVFVVDLQIVGVLVNFHLVAAQPGGYALVTTNLPFDEWTEVFGSERLTGALLDKES